MAWKETHKNESHQRILSAAAELFTRLGFDQVGIDQVMTQAGMTRGAFYAHFDSKIQLYEEAMVSAARTASNRFRANAVSLDQTIDNYLSQDHLQSLDIRCPMACLVSDVAHDNERVKQIYTRLFQGFAEHMRQPQDQDSGAGLQRALLMIGGMALARSLSDPKQAEQILTIARTAAKAV